jgi:hypothetical protein
MFDSKFIRHIYRVQESLKKYFFLRWGNKIFWVAAILVGQSERGNKRYFILGLDYFSTLENPDNRWGKQWKYVISIYIVDWVIIANVNIGAW